MQFEKFCSKFEIENFKIKISFNLKVKIFEISNLDFLNNNDIFKHCWLIWLICITVLLFIFAVTEVEQLIAVEGHPTQLPCDVTPPKPGEQVALVLWYRQDDGGEPIYR